MNEQEATTDALNATGDEETSAPVARPPRPPLWSRVLGTGVAVGALIGFVEVCWSYRLVDLNPDWRAVLPTTWGGLAAFLGIAVITDVPVVVMIALAWGVVLAIWRDVTSGPREVKDRRFAVMWGVLALAMSYLWLGWVGLFILPGAAVGTTSFVLTVAAGVAAAMVVTVPLVWTVNRLRRLHARMPLVCWSAALVVLLLVTLPSFSRQSARDAVELDIPVGDTGPSVNVLLITLDTVRFDAVACNVPRTWVQTPHLDELAAEGLRFDQAIAQSPTTTPSHCTIMTSTYPNVHDANNGLPMRTDLTTLAQCLRANEYETVAFAASTTTRSINTGLNRGFDRYIDSLVPWSELFSRDEFQHLVAFYAIGVAQRGAIRGDVVTRRALRWLDERKNGPFFCWLHYFDAHDPYDPPGAYAVMYADRLPPGTPMRQERELYAGEVSFVDEQVGRVLADLKKRGLYDNTMIVVTSDHGEGFGEQHWSYTERSHGEHLYDTTQHVPLIVKPARTEGVSRGRVVREQVELMDLAPTILDALGLPSPATFGGRSLAGLFTGGSAAGGERPAHAMAWVEVYDPQHPERTGNFVAKLAHRTRDWKYILVDHYYQEELYDLRRDPAEFDNLSKDNPELCAQRMTELKTAMPIEHDLRADPRGRLAPALRRQLEALGYLGGPSKNNSDEQDDAQAE